MGSGRCLSLGILAWRNGFLSNIQSQASRTGSMQVQQPRHMGQTKYEQRLELGHRRDSSYIFQIAFHDMEAPEPIKVSSTA